MRLNDDLGIKNTIHEDGRVILNYDQIKSPKTDDIVRECRGLVLDMNNDFSLVARSFRRFFNLGEHIEDQNKFDWNGCITTNKEDGSLVIVYFWNGDWHVNTRGSFGGGSVNNSPIIWRELFEMAVPDYKKTFDPEVCYVGELCSPYNRIVTAYERPTFFLLTTFFEHLEYSQKDTVEIARECNLITPTSIHFNDERQVVEFVRETSKDDPTWEGIVCRDKYDDRIKVKSAAYVELHRLHNNGNICTPKSLVPLIMMNEHEEILVYYPELSDYVYDLKDKIDTAYRELDDIWFCHHDEPNRKTFASKISRNPFSWALFKAKDTGQHPWEFVLENPSKMVDFIVSNT